MSTTPNDTGTGRRSTCDDGLTDSTGASMERLGSIAPVFADHDDWELPDPLDPEAIDLVADRLRAVQIPARVPLGTQVSAAVHLDGPLPWGRVPGLVATKLRHHRIHSWQDVLDLTPDSVRMWQGAGSRNLRVLLAFVIVEALRARPSDPERPGGRLSEAGDLMMQLGADAVRRFPGRSLLEAITALLEQPDLIDPGIRSALESFAVAAPSSGTAGDLSPISAIEALIGGFGERESRILDARVLPVQRSKRLTLQDLGNELGVTRERIRQLEARTVAEIRSAFDTPRFADVRRWLRTIEDQIGSAAKLADLPAPVRHVVADGDAGRLARTILFLIGDFRVEDDRWLVSARIADWPSSLSGAVEAAMAADTLPVDAAFDALASIGIPATYHDELLSGLPGLRRWDAEHVVRWGGGLPDKAAVVLRMNERPMTSPEISDLIPKGHSLGSLRNALSGDDRFVRSAKDTWSLSSWGAEEYRGIGTAITDELRDGPLPLAVLTKRLGDKWGIPAGSTQLIAAQGASFVVEADTVRLRRADEAYEPPFSLEEARDCLVVGGNWALRIPVDSDVLRGSGRFVPEPLALELDLMPGTKIDVDAGLKTMRFGWGHQRPYSGSMRLIAERLGAMRGDLLFMQVTGPRTVAFSLVGDPNQVGLEPSQRIRRLLGAPFSHRPIPDLLADALGLDEPDPHGIAARLEEKSERQLLGLWDQVTS